MATSSDPRKAPRTNSKVCATYRDVETAACILYGLTIMFLFHYYRRPVPTMLTETTIEIACAIVESESDFKRQTFVRHVAKAVSVFYLY